LPNILEGRYWLLAAAVFYLKWGLYEATKSTCLKQVDLIGALHKTPTKEAVKIRKKTNHVLQQRVHGMAKFQEPNKNWRICWTAWHKVYSNPCLNFDALP